MSGRPRARRRIVRRTAPRSVSRFGSQTSSRTQPTVGTAPLVAGGPSVRRTPAFSLPVRRSGTAPEQGSRCARAGDRGQLGCLNRNCSCRVDAPRSRDRRPDEPYLSPAAKLIVSSDFLSYALGDPGIVRVCRRVIGVKHQDHVGISPERFRLDSSDDTCDECFGVVAGRSTTLASAGRESVTLHPRDLTLDFATVGRSQCPSTAIS